MADWAGLATLVSAVLTPLGVAGAFVWRELRGRFEAIATRLDDCEERHRTSAERRATQLTVIELLWSEVARIAPESLVLQRAEKLLDGLKALVAEPKK